MKAETIEVKKFGSALLEMGTLLMAAGASTGRIRNTIDRVAAAYGYKADMLISQRTLMLSIYNKDGFLFNNLKRTPAHGVNFKVLSAISRMSWQISENRWGIEDINAEISRIRSLPHYNRLVILSLVALAGAAFCRLAGGQTVDMLVVFLGTFAGLFVRQQAAKLQFNPYMCIYFAALVSSLIAGSPAQFGLSHEREYAFATSVLFLIPGIPLINSFSDMIDGNLQNGLIRGLNGFIISFSIALGLLTSMLIYNF